MATPTIVSDKSLRALVTAPLGRDASLICTLLNRAGMDAVTVPSFDTIINEASAGAGCIILTEEALTPEKISRLREFIENQPAWSDFPVILLTLSGAVNTSNLQRHKLREPLGNLLLLERPLRPETLVSTIEGALRARRRQYQIRDQIAQFHQAEEALRRSEKLAVAGRLASSIAHEINNPLESVTNLLYLIRSAHSLDEARSYLATAEQELARVTEIATQTLKFYRQPAKAAPVSLPEVLDSVLLLYHPRLAAAGVEIKKRFASVPLVIGMSGELRQVFSNLIGNALDAMRQGGTLWLRIDHAPSRSGVRTILADTGPGIPPSLRPKVFEPFVSTKGVTGTGLGLWVTSEIVSKHGGTIRFKSKTNGSPTGTVFSVFLPAQQQPPEPIPLRAPRDTRPAQ